MNIRFALLGAGRIGQVHAKAITTNSGAELVAVADLSHAAASLVSDRFGGDYRTIDSIADAADIDAVVISTPTHTHADLIETFARSGKAIFCEKPIDLNVARVKTCLETVAQTGATLMLGFNRRFDPNFLALKAAIDGGAVGQIEMLNITSRDPGAPPADYIKTSGGIFRDMTIHDFDMARFLLADTVVSVFASASVLVDQKIGRLGDFDSANILLTTAGGKQCVISNSRRATYGYDQRIEVLGSLGAVTAENLRPVSIEIANAQGFTRPPLHDFFMTRYTAAYAAEIAAFITALNTGKTPSPGGRDGLKALMLAEAALKSIATGSAVHPGI